RHQHDGEHDGGAGGAERITAQEIAERAPAAAAIGRSSCNRLGLLPPPLWGRGGEGGRCCCASYVHNSTPTPNPSPQGGGELTEFVAPVCDTFTARNLNPRSGCADRARRRPCRRGS